MVSYRGRDCRKAIGGGESEATRGVGLEGRQTIVAAGYRGDRRRIDRAGRGCEGARTGRGSGLQDGRGGEVLSELAEGGGRD